MATSSTVPVSDSADYVVPFFLNGEEVRSEKVFDVISPSSGEVVFRCSSAGLQEAKQAVDSAAEAFKTWRKVTPGRRRDIFIKTSEILERRRKELAGYMMLETGAAEGWADFNLTLAIDFVKDLAGRIASIEGFIPTTADETVGAMVVKEPYGVVLGIAPWNAPGPLGTRAVAFPLAAGNAVVLKASELSPRFMWGLVSCFHEAGVPKGVLNTIVVEPSNAAEVTAALIENEHVKKINFTGSTAVGRIIAGLAGKNLKPVLMELGGKAPAIVWEDANLDLAAAQCALGAFFHGGQICMSTERILVHKNVATEFEKKLAASVEQFFPSQADAPVLVNSVGVEKNKKLLQDALSKGASVVSGNPDAEETTKTRMRPVIIKNVTSEMAIYKTESFGPTVSIIEIETEEEALRIANDTEYGLTSAIFTEDLRRALRLAKEIETGAVHINGMSVHDESSLPHGGAKASGFGRFNSIGLEEWVRTKSITFKF